MPTREHYTDANPDTYANRHPYAHADRYSIAYSDADVRPGDET